MLPTITVVTATFNAAKDLPKLFESLREQTDRDFQFVVMDGASGDGTREMIASASDIVTHTRSEPDFGFFDALNKAVRMVATDYYITMGADDTLYPDAIDNLKKSAGETQADILVVGVKAGARVLKGYHPEKRWLSPSAMWTSHSVGTLLRTNLHKRFGYYTLKYPIYADTLFMKKVALASDVKVAEGKFIAGEFCVDGGFSSANYVRSLCELWMMQRETGENPFLQYLLFQLRLLRNFKRVVSQ
jgi:glycosyltransferase involved in cell wall biosynthesis